MAAIYCLANGTIQQAFSTWMLEQQALAGTQPAGPDTGWCVGPGSFALSAGSCALAAGVAFSASALDAPNIVQFDESLNAALALDIVQNFALYSAPTVNSAPQLQKSGKAVTIAAASELYTLRAQLSAVPEPTLEAYATALWAGTATTAQSQKALAFVLIKLRIAGLI